MAGKRSDSDGSQAEGTHGPRECMPCRGTGRVISNLGGAQSKVPCPWCRGGGVRVVQVDAQERWLGKGAAEGVIGDGARHAR